MKMMVAGFSVPAAVLLYCLSVDSLPNATSLNVLKESKLVAVTNTSSVKLYAAKIKPYLRQHAYNEQICSLVDMKIAPGRSRFFVYDFKIDSVVDKGLVIHGGGSQTATDALSFSNIANSNATSVDRYKIGNEYSGNFGMAFKLHGLYKINARLLIVLYFYIATVACPMLKFIHHAFAQALVAPL